MLLIIEMCYHYFAIVILSGYKFSAVVLYASRNTESDCIRYSV